jgi:hypothetical protein
MFWPFLPLNLVAISPNRELFPYIAACILFHVPIFCAVGLEIRWTASPVHDFTQLQLSQCYENQRAYTFKMHAVYLRKTARETSCSLVAGQEICGVYVCELAALKGEPLLLKRS